MDHATKVEDEGKFVNASGPDPIAEARRLHHLATADPERDGVMTGPAHEEKYGLERAQASAVIWRGAGVHPTENRALQGDEDGAENLHGVGASEEIATADASATDKRTAAAPRASGK